MDHAIIGFSEKGAECLLRLNRLCDERSTDESKPFLFHVGCTENIPVLKQISSIRRVLFQANLRKIGVETAGKLIFDTLGREQFGGIKQDLPSSRRAYAECFKLGGDVLWQQLETIYHNNTNFHLIADIADTEAAGMLPDVLEGLCRRYGKARIGVHLLYSAGYDKTSGKTTAQAYATLLECRVLHSAQVGFSLYPFADKRAEDEMMGTCAHQIYSALSTSMPISTLLLNNDEPSLTGSTFFGVKEAIIFTDMQKMRTTLCAQLAAQIMMKLFYADSDQLSSPAWIDDLFIDKKWLLHPDFLSMEQDFNASSAHAEHSSVEKEWASRIQFFLSKQNDSDEWDDQLAKMTDSLNTVAQKLFRGRGIGLFYAINESGVVALAKRIVTQIETELVEEWRKNAGSVICLHEWLSKISDLVERKLSACRNRRQQQSDASKNFLQQYQSIQDEWRSAGRGDRKRIQKAYPIEDMASLLGQHYIADCHAKAMTFACKLLLAVIGELDDLQKMLRQSEYEDLQALTSKLPKSSSVSVQNTVNMSNEAIWKVAIDADLPSMMPPAFAKAEAELHAPIRELVIREIKADKGMVGIVSALNEPGVFDNILQYISTHHVFLQHHHIQETEILFFWRAVSAFLSDPQPTLQLLLSRWSEQQSEQTYHKMWFFPPCAFGKNILNHAVTVCQQYVPGSHALVNVGMDFPCLLYREIHSMSLPDLVNIGTLQSAYEEMIFSHYGAAYSFLLHTQNKAPFPEYEKSGDTPSPDEVRQYLLQGEICGVITEKAVGDKCMVYLSTSGSHLPLGSSFPDVLTRITPFRLKLLSYAVNATDLKTVSAEKTREILENRLEIIKVVCLNGKTDLRHADWKEAGSYMPWSRKVDQLLS